MSVSLDPHTHERHGCSVTLDRLGAQVVCIETDLITGRRQEHGPCGQFCLGRHLRDQSVVKLVWQTALTDRNAYPLAREFCNQHPDLNWHLPEGDALLTVTFHRCEHTVLSFRPLEDGTIVCREQLVSDGSIREVGPTEPLYGCTGYANKKAGQIVRGTCCGTKDPIIRALANRFCHQQPQ